MIIYPKRSGWDQHIYSPHQSKFNSGSDFFLRELDREHCALIAWHIPNTVDNSQLNVRHFSNHARENSEEINRQNPGLRYVLTVSLCNRCPYSTGNYKRYRHVYYTINQDIPEVGNPSVDEDDHNICSFSSKFSNVREEQRPRIIPFSV